MGGMSRAMFGALATIWMATPALAGGNFSYFGPTPYTSSADSPFAIKDFGYCIETFEDGTLDVPGVTGNGVIVGPGGNIDSVDADDGSIDGSGTNGHSYFTGNGAGGITFTFTNGRANGFPTKVGIVWTDGGFGATVIFDATGGQGQNFDAQGPFLHADNSNQGQTAEDRFYGVTSSDGISSITISNLTGGIEVDHLQLDRCVVCGDANLDSHITVSDALIALKTSVGTDSCLLCVCDTNDSSSNSATDALTILKKTVGQNPVMNCPDCVF